MMLQSIDKAKLCFYLYLILMLVSIHNINYSNKVNGVFKIKKIEVVSDLDEDINNKILSSLKKLHNQNIFSINYHEVEKILNNFNIINEYKLKKEFPSKIKIELKKTILLAYFFENDEIFFVGNNGKKIKIKKKINDKLPLIVGKVDIDEFIKLINKLNNQGFNLNDFSTFYYFKSKRWDLLYKNEILVKLSSYDLDFSLNLLKQIIQNLNKQEFKIIDLRIKDWITFS